MPRHVVLLSRDSSLAVALRMLLGEADVVTEIDRPAQWPSSAELPVSTAVVDLPAGWRLPGVEQVRARFSGPLVVLLSQDEDAGGIPAEHACTIMRRPFEIMTLWSLVTGATPAASASASGAGTAGTAGTGAAASAREAPVGPPPGAAKPPLAPPRRRANVPPASDAPGPPVAPVAPAAAASLPPAPAPDAPPARKRGPERKPKGQPSRAPASPVPPAAPAPEAPAAARPGGEPEPAWSGRLRRLHDAPPAPSPAAPAPSPQPPPPVPQSRPEREPAAGDHRQGPPPPVVPAPPAPSQRPGPAAGVGEPLDRFVIDPEDASPLPGLPVKDRLQRLRDLPTTATARARPGSGSGPIATAPLPDHQPAPEAGPGFGGSADRPPEHPSMRAPAASPAPPAPPAAPPVAAPRRGATRPSRSHPAGPPPAPAAPAAALLADLREAAAEAQRRAGHAPGAGRPSAPGGSSQPDAATGPDPVAEALAGQPPEVFERDLPRQTVERAAGHAKADVVALLLDNGEGVLEVWAGTGLSAAERRLRVDYSREVIRELFRVGVGLIDSTDRVRSALTAIPGSEAETLVMIPLIHQGLGFGAIIAGRNQQPSGPPPAFDDPEVERLMDLANDLAPALRTAVLLRKLRRPQR